MTSHSLEGGMLQVNGHWVDLRGIHMDPEQAKKLGVRK